LFDCVITKFLRVAPDEPWALSLDLPADAAVESLLAVLRALGVWCLPRDQMRIEEQQRPPDTFRLSRCSKSRALPAPGARVWLTNFSTESTENWFQLPGERVSGKLRVLPGATTHLWRGAAVPSPSPAREAARDALLVRVLATRRAALLLHRCGLDAATLRAGKAACATSALLGASLEHCQALSGEANLYGREVDAATEAEPSACDVVAEMHERDARRLREDGANVALRLREGLMARAAARGCAERRGSQR
jgi:hypothetical protein